MAGATNRALKAAGHTAKDIRRIRSTERVVSSIATLAPPKGAAKRRPSLAARLRAAVAADLGRQSAATPSAKASITEAPPQKFASDVLAVARAAKSGRWGEHKVFVSQIWDDLRRRGEAGDFAAFKRRLVDANRRGLLRLSRADLVEAMDQKLVKHSEIESLGATFHFVRTD
jgi:hypothetical protein